MLVSRFGCRKLKQARHILVCVFAHEFVCMRYIWINAFYKPLYINQIFEQSKIRYSLEATVSCTYDPELISHLTYWNNFITKNCISEILNFIKLAIIMACPYRRRLMSMRLYIIISQISCIRYFIFFSHWNAGVVYTALVDLVEYAQFSSFQC